MRTYTEAYLYDHVGNILALAHMPSQGNAWTRTYAYDEPNAPPTNNRLTSTMVGSLKDVYTYDPHGNMTTMPQLTLMAWDFKDQLQSTQQQGVNDGTGERTYYVYNAAGQRIRKVTERSNGTRMKERIYLGGYEVYREYGFNAAITLERQTLHVMDDTRRVALVETTTIDAKRDFHLIAEHSDTVSVR